MEKNINNKRGIYGLTYGYSDIKIHFIATREEFEKFKNKEISIETSKHSYEEVKLSDVYLITEDEDFIKKYEDFGLEGDSPYYYVEDEDYED